MVEIIEFLGHPVSIDGGSYQTLSLRGGDLIQTSSATPPLVDPEPDTWQLSPVLPVLNQAVPQAPFVTAAELLSHAAEGQPLSELAVQYEAARSGRSAAEVVAQMEEIVGILADSLQTPSADDVPGRILPNQAGLLADATLFGGDFTRDILYYVTRFMDIKTSMGVFVAAPTAGSAGCLPGVVFALTGAAHDPGHAAYARIGRQSAARALLAAGMIGVFIAQASTFAAEICGCQAECGAGSGMAAAAVAELLGCDAPSALSAAAMALQNVFGMVCDPVANRVEIPCLGKNVMAAFNAVAAANMVNAGFAEPIGLDDTIAAMDQVGRAIPADLRCTGCGGLSTTPVALQLLRRKPR
jgi:L-serine dehydratase